MAAKRRFYPLEKSLYSTVPLYCECTRALTFFFFGIVSQTSRYPRPPPRAGGRRRRQRRRRRRQGRRRRSALPSLAAAAAAAVFAGSPRMHTASSASFWHASSTTARLHCVAYTPAPSRAAGGGRGRGGGVGVGGGWRHQTTETGVKCPPPPPPCPERQQGLPSEHMSPPPAHIQHMNPPPAHTFSTVLSKVAFLWCAYGVPSTFTAAVCREYIYYSLTFEIFFSA